MSSGMSDPTDLVRMRRPTLEEMRKMSIVFEWCSSSVLALRALYTTSVFGAKTQMDPFSDRDCADFYLADVAARHDLRFDL
jgi:hypothetical protein